MPAPFRSARLPVLVGVCALAVAACTFDPTPRGSGLTSTGSAVTGAAGTTGAAGSIYVGGGGTTHPSTGTGGTAVFGGGGPGATVPIPAGYTNADIGAFKTGDQIPANGGTTMIDSPQTGCYQVTGVVRDFKGFDVMGHPDFEHYSGNAATTGLVSATLGADRKPVYTSKCEIATVPLGTTTADCPYGPETTTKADYDEWYRTTDGVNVAFSIDFIFEPNGTTTTFSSETFFPLDGVAGAFGNSGTLNGVMHDYGFTTELHTKFKYDGGEQFTFTGDDDLWVFINGKLALDLGGLHPRLMGTVDMDASAAQLGITRGNVYNIELFHAERHTTESHFRVDTNFVFVDCGTIIP
jgi:fibro-slime domain-containing protein